MSELNPIAQAGYITQTGALACEGSTYTGSPVLGGGTLPVGSSALALRVGRGQVILALGGYYAPEAQEGGQPPPDL